MDAYKKWIGMGSTANTQGIIAERKDSKLERGDP